MFVVACAFVCVEEHLSDGFGGDFGLLCHPVPQLLDPTGNHRVIEKPACLHPYGIIAHVFGAIGCSIRLAGKASVQVCAGECFLFRR